MDNSNIVAIIILCLLFLTIGFSVGAFINNCDILMVIGPIIGGISIVAALVSIYISYRSRRGVEDQTKDIKDFIDQQNTFIDGLINSPDEPNFTKEKYEKEIDLLESYKKKYN